MNTAGQLLHGLDHNPIFRLYEGLLRRHGPGVDKKRRLPVLNAPPAAGGGEEEEGEARPPWHWIGFGTVAVFAVWLPLSYVAELVRVRAMVAWIGSPPTAEATAEAIAALSPEARAKLGLVLFFTHGSALALAAFAGGMLVGRYGGAQAGVREAALAGLMAALVATLLAWGGVSWVPLVTIAVATLAAALGGRAGKRRRP